MFPPKSRGRRFFDPDVAIVKFNSFWTIELEPGYSLFATHPVNRADLPFRLLTGVVDCDRFTDVGILFPGSLDGSEFRRRAARAARPIAQCFPIVREALDASIPGVLGGRSGTICSPPRRCCSLIPAHIAGDFVCGASVQASSKRRSRARFSHRRPFLADVSAWAMRPNVSGRSRIARR